MAISYRLVGNLGGEGYYFSPADGARYKVPAGQYEVFIYRSVTARQVEIRHSRHGESMNVVTGLSGGITTPDGVEWIEIKGAEKAIIMPTDQLDKRVPDRA